MQVTLLAYTPDPERTVASAARLCYSAADIETVREKLTPEKTAAFVEMLGSMGHDSPIEHAVFTFGIEGVSRSLLAQITRHRIASFSVQSQRYVRENTFEYVVPPCIADIPEAMEEYQRAMAEDQRHYESLTEKLREKHLRDNLAAGMEQKAAERAAEKSAIEDARFVLPNACETKMILTMNARSLQNFFRHRCCTRAQWEIRELAEAMLRLVRQVAPNLFAHSGPSCVAGPCPEGKMTCGRAAEMRERYVPEQERKDG